MENSKLLICCGDKMDPIYVTGHWNPDTDSIISAMAYAALRNALGDREYIAARLGNVSDETQAVLDFFEATPPRLITNVRTQIRDLDFDTPPTLGRKVTLNKAWETLKRVLSQLFTLMVNFSVCSQRVILLLTLWMRFSNSASLI